MSSRAAVAPSSPSSTRVHWTASERTHLLALHSQQDASSPRFWHLIAQGLGSRPGKDAAECQRQWQSCFPSPPAPAAQTKKRTARGSGADLQPSPATRKRAKVTHSPDAAASPSSPSAASPAAAAADGGARPRRPRVQKPTLRELFEQHHSAASGAAAAGGSSVVKPASAHHSAAATVEEEDDFFAASPFKALRAREQLPSADATAASSPSSLGDNADDDDDENTPAAAPARKPGRGRKQSATGAAGKRTASRADAQSHNTRSLLQHLRAGRTLDNLEHDLDAAVAATDELHDDVEGLPSSASLLAELPARAKTDAYVRSFQRLTRQAHGIGGAKLKAAKLGAGVAGKSSAAAAASSLSVTNALRAALRAQDRRALRAHDRVEAANEADEDEEGGPPLDGFGDEDGEGDDEDAD